MLRQNSKKKTLFPGRGGLLGGGVLSHMSEEKWGKWGEMGENGGQWGCRQEKFITMLATPLPCSVFLPLCPMADQVHLVNGVRCVPIKLSCEDPRLLLWFYAFYKGGRGGSMRDLGSWR